MKKYILKTTVLLTALTLVVSSCKNTLDLAPMNDVTGDVVYSTFQGYQESLAKVYGSFALTGNAGPAGAPDVVGLDEGSNGDFLRTFWKAQELSTDEAIISWGDAGIQDFHNMNWNSSNPFLKGFYYKDLYQITLANEFLRQSTDAEVAKRGITGADADAIKAYRNEVRFIRAFDYWALLDLYGNVPFTTENNPIGGPLPTQMSKADLFKYIESELKEIEPLLPAVKDAAHYGRATQYAADALLARLYLNAEVYTGTARYADALTYAKKVIDSDKFSLTPNYRNIGLNDNNTSPEFIFTINYDGQKTQGYGGTTFLAHACVGGSMNAANYGLDGGWAGLRTTSAFVNQFADPSGNTDKRANFYNSGQNLEISSVSTFTDGYAIPKFQNKDSQGISGINATFVSADFPVFRLAEMYLIYAEANLRGGGGDLATAIGYINLLRERAYGDNSGNVTSINLDFILAERSRELYWEGHRRTDLIRFAKFTSDTYLWPWKGGVKEGKGVESFRALYPLPSDDVNANPNLTQNTGY
ncbi:MAG: RagB/SusD family nutrient uptake outer membrane protein [Sphingobacteriales bacterium]|nr:RagB/SusD family nutrient uptake outer membrane protein [Sphingobacteriales bacterium]